MRHRYVSLHRRRPGRGLHAAARRGLGLYCAAVVSAAAAIASLVVPASPNGGPGILAQAGAVPQRPAGGLTAMAGDPATSGVRGGDQPSRLPEARPDAQPKPAPKKTAAAGTRTTQPAQTTAAAAAAAPAPEASEASPVASPSEPDPSQPDPSEPDPGAEPSESPSPGPS